MWTVLLTSLLWLSNRLRSGIWLGASLAFTFLFFSHSMVPLAVTLCQHHVQRYISFPSSSFLPEANSFFSTICLYLSLVNFLSQVPDEEKHIYKRILPVTYLTVLTVFFSPDTMLCIQAKNMVSPDPEMLFTMHPGLMFCIPKTQSGIFIRCFLLPHTFLSYVFNIC